MICYHARWIAPVSAPPIRDGTVAESGGRIVYVGPRSTAPDGAPCDLGHAIIVPGLVNAHTHLELTLLRGLIADMPFREWIARLQQLKTTLMTPERYGEAARLGIAEGVRAGVTTFADTCDSGVALAAMRDAGVRGIMYQEVFCPSPDPQQVAAAANALREKVAGLEPLETDLQRLGISPHAPYTVSDPLFALVARSGRPIAVHIAESDAECALVSQGDGPFASALRDRGIPVAPRARTPVELLRRVGVLDQQPLLIHCVHADEADRCAIADAGATVAHCPISNAKLGHGTAPLMELLDAHIPVGLGSDSMASNDRMDLLDEARAAVLAQRARTHRSDALPAARALHLLTLGGARALGLDARIGSLEPGKDADLAAFVLPESMPDADPVALLIFGLVNRPAVLVTVRGQRRV
ncbi:MAG: amidohydrolase family protein [Gemmatimonadaceae bacterium]